MLLLLLLGVLGQEASAGLVGVSKCSFGPSYWCASIPQASECRAVQHCIKAVWEKERVPVDEDEVCRICKDMVGQARDTLLSNETQEELKEVFDGSCDLIPIKIVAKECRTLFDQFVPELVETLASEMNPDTVCTVSGLCNSDRIDRMLAKMKMTNNKVDRSSCAVCQSEMSKIQKQLISTPDDQISTKLTELCGGLGSYSDVCMYYVSTHLQDVLSILRTEISPALCQQPGLCEATTAANYPTAGDDLQCEFCSKVVKHWITVYASNASLEEFKELLDGVCDKLDTKNSAHCKHVVDDIYMPMFEFVRTLDPHMVCSLAGLCSSSDSNVPKTASFVPKKITKMAPLLKAKKNMGSTEKPSCMLCEFIMQKLAAYLKDGQSVDEVKAYVENICQKMPGFCRAECKTLVDTYEPIIVQLLASEIDPAQVCKEIQLCDQSSLVPVDKSAPVTKGGNCESCQFIMDEVFSVLSDKDDQMMVRNVLESVCYRLPASLDQRCEQFVDQYTPMILDLISKSLTPEEICSALDLCEGKKIAKTDVAKNSQNLKDTGCVLCEYVISNLDKILSDSKNEAEIKDALENVCSYLPSSVRKQCDQFVESYTELIIQLLTGEVTPQELCGYIGLCTDKIRKELPYVIDSSKGPYCTLCEYAISTVDTMLQDSKTEDEIKQTLDIVCYHLTAPVHKECVKMVDQYTDEIIQLLVNDYTPEQVCLQISLCVNSEISSNDIDALDFPVSTSDNRQAVNKDSIVCVMCEFAMQVLDEHLDDASTIDQVERMVQLLCSYLPGTISDQCEEFVDQNGKKIIDALINKELNPKEVCTLGLNLCDGSNTVTRSSCSFGPELWCSTPFHAKICNAEQFCQATAWRLVKNYNF